MRASTGGGASPYGVAAGLFNGDSNLDLLCWKMTFPIHFVGHARCRRTGATGLIRAGSEVASICKTVVLLVHADAVEARRTANEPGQPNAGARMRAPLAGAAVRNESGAKSQSAM